MLVNIVSLMSFTFMFLSFLGDWKLFDSYILLVQVKLLSLLHYVVICDGQDGLFHQKKIASDSYCVLLVDFYPEFDHETPKRI